MSLASSHNERRLGPDLKAGIAQRFVQVGVTDLSQAAVLILSSGRLNWGWAWVFIVLNLVGIAINATVLLRYSPETIAERAKADGMKDWDRVVAGLWAVTHFVLTMLIAGLDRRWGWTGLIGFAVHVAGAVAFVLGSALFSWAMISNAYLAAVVRIQEERGHTVCTSGPYRYVRHPGYVGAIAQSLDVPLMLGSLWSLIPGGLAVLLMTVRTALEDRTLHQELGGYRDYAQRVRYRLLPGIW